MSFKLFMLFFTWIRSYDVLNINLKLPKFYIVTNYKWVILFQASTAPGQKRSTSELEVAHGPLVDPLNKPCINWSFGCKGCRLMNRCIIIIMYWSYAGRWQRWLQLHQFMSWPSSNPSSNTLTGSSPAVKHLVIFGNKRNRQETVVLANFIVFSLQRWTSTFQACSPCPAIRQRPTSNPTWTGSAPAAWGRTGTVTPLVKTGTCLVPTSASAWPAPRHWAGRSRGALRCRPFM